jgi:hypothetical protein
VNVSREKRETEILQSLMEKLCLGKNATGRIQSMLTCHEFTELRISSLNFIPTILFSFSYFYFIPATHTCAARPMKVVVIKMASNAIQYETSASHNGNY